MVEEDRTARANLKHLREYAARTEWTAPRRIVLRFLASPVEVAGQVVHPNTGEVVAGEVDTASFM